MRAWIATGCATVGGALLLGLLTAPSSYSAPKTPAIGSKCSAKQAWTEYSGRAQSTFNPKTGKYVTKFKASDKKLKKADRLICVPVGWNPESDPGSFSGGKWELVAWPDISSLANIKNDDFLYGITDELQPCAIPSRTKTANSHLSFFDREGVGFLPSDGRVRGLIIPWVDNQLDRDSGELMNPNARSELNERGVARRYLDQLVEVGDYVHDYYADASQGRLNIELRPVRRIFYSEDYTSVGGGIYSNDKLTYAQEAGVNFGGIDFVIFDEFMGTKSKPKRDGFRAATPSSIPGIYNVYNDTESYLGDPGKSFYVAVHEIGHMLGLPDLYAEQSYNPLNTRFSGNLSVMHGSLKYGFRGWERWVLGWLRNDEVRCVSEPTKESVAVEFRSLDDHRFPGSLKMIVFVDPSERERVFVSELRAPDPNLRAETLADVSFLTYEVNPQSTSARFAGSGISGQDFEEHAPLVVWREDASTLAVTPRADGLPLDHPERRSDGDDLRDASVDLAEFLETEANLTGGGMSGPIPIPTSHQPWSSVSYPELTTQWEFDLRNPDALCGAIMCGLGGLTYEYTG